ncbi:protein of unknown function [Legionella pneumophila subsp. pneumophila]|nr:protein of unknown function [Legionella pneumophila subsp. pneumophila]
MLVIQILKVYELHLKSILQMVYSGNIGNTLGPKGLHKLPRSSGLKNATSPYQLIIYISIHPPEF